MTNIDTKIDKLNNNNKLMLQKIDKISESIDSPNLTDRERKLKMIAGLEDIVKWVESDYGS